MSADPALNPSLRFRTVVHREKHSFFLRSPPRSHGCLALLRSWGAVTAPRASTEDFLYILHQMSSVPVRSLGTLTMRGVLALCWWERNWCSHWGRRFLKKLKTELRMIQQSRSWAPIQRQPYLEKIHAPRSQQHNSQQPRHENNLNVPGQRNGSRRCGP